MQKTWETIKTWLKFVSFSKKTLVRTSDKVKIIRAAEIESRKARKR